jgi:pilus assembly protein CpaB
MVAAIGVTQMMADSGDKEGSGGAVEPIYVALEDIEMGKPISVEVIKLEDWPKGKTPAGALSQLDDVEGRAPRAKIFAGEPILDLKLLTKGEMGDGADIMIPKNYRVVPIRVDEVSGGASMILPGNRVDVYLHVKKCSEFKESMVRQILQNVKVFAVDNTWTRMVDDQKTIRAKTVSLLLPPAQAMKVTLAAKTGELSLVLRSPEDDEATEVEQMGVRDLFGGSELANTQKDSDILYEEDKSAENKQNFLELLKGAEAGTPAAPDTWRVRVLSGQTLTDVSLVELEGDRVLDSSLDENGSSGFWKMTTPLDNSTEKPSYGARREVKKTARNAEPDGVKDGQEEPDGDDPEQPLEE